MPAPRLCSVPSAEVLALTAELAGLGSGDLAVGRCWAGAAAAAADGAASLPSTLDARCPDACALASSLQQELWAWLRKGYNATALLLLDSGSSAASRADATSHEEQLSAAALVASLGGAALAEGWRLGLSWQLASGSSVWDAAGQQQQQQQPEAGAARSMARPGSSRLARGEPAKEVHAPPPISAASPSELLQLLSVATQQAQQLAAAAAAAEGTEPPALLLRFELLGPCKGQAAVLHVLQAAAACGSASPAGGSLWDGLLRLAGEVADLHQRRREGEHLLASAKLSALNRLAAPLLCGGSRLFSAAALPDSSGGGPSVAGCQRLLRLLCSLQSVQSVCGNRIGVAGGGSSSRAAAEDASAWLPCQQFLRQMVEKSQAERERRAKAAALAAAEASRREKLRAEAQQQRQQGQQPTAVGQRPAAARGGSRQVQEAPEQTATAGRRAAAHASGSPAGSPGLHGQAAERQRDGVQGPAAAGPSAAGAATDPGQEEQQAAADGQPSPSSSSSGLRGLREEFQALYASIAAPAQQQQREAERPSSAAAAALAAEVASPAKKWQLLRSTAQEEQQPGNAGANASSPGVQRAQQQCQQQQTIAAGVAAADDVATHVAALRMQAAAEARLALQAEEEMFARAAAAAGSMEEEAAGEAQGQAGGRGSEQFSSGPASRPGSGACGLGEQLEADLALQQQAGARQFEAAVDGWAAGLGEAEAASLAVMDAEGAPSLAALYRTPASAASVSAAQRASWQAYGERQQQQDGRWSAQHGRAGTAAAGSGRYAAFSPGLLAVISPSPDAAEAEVSDLFQSDCMPQFTPPAAAAAAAGPAVEAALPPWQGAAASGSWWAEGGSSSYSASWRQQGGRTSLAAGPAASASGLGVDAGTASTEHSRQGQAWPGQQHEERQGDLLPALHAGAISSALRPAASAGPGAASEAAALVEELQREQRVNSALLQQLHEVQQALEEAVAAAAALQQPLAAGAEDPADFEGLLAALQRERQLHAALQRRTLLQQQQAEEQQLGLRLSCSTLERQLAASAARCRAWEQQSPLPALFRRYEEEHNRQLAEGQRLEGENRQLCAMLAQIELDRLADMSTQLGDESVAAVCREHQRKLQQAQAQIRRLHEQLAAQQQGAHERRRGERLTEICRKQVEKRMKEAEQLQFQLASKERHLEAQSMAAAEAVAEAARLRERLQGMELELGRALADRAELGDAVSSLRQQVALLRGQGSRDRVLRSLQC